LKNEFDSPQFTLFLHHFIHHISHLIGVEIFDAECQSRSQAVPIEFINQAHIPNLCTSLIQYRQGELRFGNLLAQKRRISRSLSADGDRALPAEAPKGKEMFPFLF